MKRIVPIVLLLMIPACAQTSGSTSSTSGVAQNEATFSAMVQAVASTCRRPKTILRLSELELNGRKVIAAANNITTLEQVAAEKVALQQVGVALLALDQVCKSETENCGTGPAVVGMTTKEAIHTSWCFPDKTNTTWTAGHTSEQWVYEGRGYLYFDDGRLTAIQE